MENKRLFKKSTVPQRRVCLKLFWFFIDDYLNHLKLGFVVSCGKVEFSEGQSFLRGCRLLKIYENLKCV